MSKYSKRSDRDRMFDPLKLNGKKLGSKLNELARTNPQRAFELLDLNPNVNALNLAGLVNTLQREAAGFRITPEQIKLICTKANQLLLAGGNFFNPISIANLINGLAHISVVEIGFGRDDRRDDKHYLRTKPFDKQKQQVNYYFD